MIFDLFGTLVPSSREDIYLATLRETGIAVGADPEVFLRYWCDGETARRRATGGFRTQAECIEYICRQLGLTPTEDAIRRAGSVRTEYQCSLLVPRPDAVQTLKKLKETGLKLCLMSVCTPCEPTLWARTALALLFDEALFSCEVGLLKPDPRFYALACERLAVQPERCLYVGDGFGDELTGARKAGMDAVLMCAVGEEEIVMRHEGNRDWDGPRITSLTEVPALVN